MAVSPAPPTSNSDDAAGANENAPRFTTQHLLVLVGLFALVGLTQFGSVLKPYRLDIRATVASDGLFKAADQQLLAKATPRRGVKRVNISTFLAATNASQATIVQKSKITAPIITNEKKEKKKKKFILMNCHKDEWALFVRTELYYIFGGLIDDYGWEEKNAEEVSKMEEAPDAILYCENNVRFNDHKYFTYRAFQVMKVEELRKKGTKIAIYNDDTHVFNQYSREQMAYILGQTDAILSTYAYLLKYWFNDFQNSKHPDHVWIPHSASPSYTQLEFNENPDRLCFWSGAEDPTLYPMRAYLKRQYIFRDHPGWTAKGHPGYGKHSHNQTASYAQRIHRHFCGLSTTMAIRRLVAKSFEVPATGALLIVNDDLEPLFKVLGLESKQNYIALPNNNPDPTIKWVLDPSNYEEIDKIRKRGMDVIRSQHTTANRALQIHEYFTKGKEPFPHQDAAKLLKEHPCPMSGTASEISCINTRKKLYHWIHFKPNALSVPPFNTARRRRRR